MERSLRNRILIFLALAAIVAYLLIHFSGRQPVAKVAVVTPAREDLVAAISSNGKVEAISPSVMRAQLATFVEKVYVPEGQSVKKGQRILDLDVKDAAVQLAEARAKLLRAQDDLRQARSGGRKDDAARLSGDLAKAQAQRDRLARENEALKRLVAQQAATKEELAANELELARAQAELDRTSAAKQEFDRQVKLDSERLALQVDELSNAAASLEDKVRTGHITAPGDGTVYSLPVKTGSYVNVGELLAEMADLREVRVRAFIDEPDLGALEPNQPVTITWDALPNRAWHGHTEVIPKQVVPRSARSVGELLCSVNNEKIELLPNVNVSVRIVVKERHNVLAVPRGAVQIQGGNRFVFVVKDNGLSVTQKKLEKRLVVVGIASATSFEILSGLQEGEVVALPGDADLKDGMPIQVVNPQ
jgi:HlyD family secretion protein